MSESCSHDCSSCSQNCGDRSQPQSLLESLHPLSHVKKVFAVVSGKGGVGKSMVTSLLAVLMQRRGFSTAVLDADVTGPSIPRVFGLTQKAEGDGETIFPVRTKTGIDVMSLNLLLENDTDPVVWRGPVISGVVKQFWTDVIWKDIDCLFIDMPPGTGDVPLTVFQSIPVDGILIVTTPQELVGMIVEKAAHMAEMMKIPLLGLIENMSCVTCPDCGVRIYPFGQDRVAPLAERFHTRILAQLPIDPKLAAAADAGLIELFDGDWLDSAADALAALLDA